jgi:AcrR family transcriptional regulator
MSSRRQPIPDSRSPLSRQRVLRAAIEIADSEGIDALTMRRLAQQLSVEAMSLYHHVANKNEILTEIVDLVITEFELPRRDVGWKSALRRTATSAHATLIRHPWAANLMLSGEARGARLRYMDGILGCLRGGGFSAEMTHHAYHAIDSHILGFTLWQVGIAATAREVPDLARTFLATLPVAEYPYLAEHVEQHISESAASGATEFEFGLDLILDGLEDLLREPAELRAETLPAQRERVVDVARAQTPTGSIRSTKSARHAGASKGFAK